MLNFNNVKFEFLEKSYTSNKILIIFGSLVIIAAFIYLVVKMFKNEENENLDFFIFMPGIPFLFLLLWGGINLPFSQKVPCYKTLTEVELPEEEAVVKYMQKDNRLIEKDGKMYFVKIFKEPAIGGVEHFKNNTDIKFEIQEDLEKTWDEYVKKVIHIQNENEKNLERAKNKKWIEENTN